MTRAVDTPDPIAPEVLERLSRALRELEALADEWESIDREAETLTCGVGWRSPDREARARFSERLANLNSAWRSAVCESAACLGAVRSLGAAPAWRLEFEQRMSAAADRTERHAKSVGDAGYALHVGDALVDPSGRKLRGFLGTIRAAGGPSAMFHVLTRRQRKGDLPRFRQVMQNIDLDTVARELETPGLDDPFRRWLRRNVMGVLRDMFSAERGEPGQFPATPDADLEMLASIDAGADDERIATSFEIATAGLSPREEEIYRAVEIEGLRVAKAARASGISPGTARHHLHNARRKLAAAHQERTVRRG